ncbi:uncharacterized protein LOC123444213 isoform X5 [Hordeum vulgare subsp. vulgare]|uniref:uncharacterized protein LOC123444213 isoform X5 n=1 Tax=Hordeum vulgare subsp. vulgare TaxID=112509 RepID=UPI001D1A5401|nr:uncharacterized protein LOC123444213 isoform X5 [Hordeum vulgare subsp. vulgare]
MHFQLDHDPSTIGVSTTHDLGKMDLLVTRCRMLLSISCEGVHPDRLVNFLATSGPWKLDHDMISPFPCPDICRRPASQRGHMMYCVSFLMTHGLDAIFCMLRSASCKHPKEGQSTPWIMSANKLVYLCLGFKESSKSMSMMSIAVV